MEQQVEGRALVRGFESAAFVNLRALNPEHEHWRRGVEDAAIYARKDGDLRVPLTS